MDGLGRGGHRIKGGGVPLIRYTTENKNVLILGVSYFFVLTYK
jgi:hypothetical protein